MLQNGSAKCQISKNITRFGLESQMLLNLSGRSGAVTRTLIGVCYSCIHVLPDGFLFKLINFNLIRKQIRRPEHEYINLHPQLAFFYGFEWGKETTFGRNVGCNSLLGRE